MWRKSNNSYKTSRKKKSLPVTEERIWSYCLWYLGKYRVTVKKCQQKLNDKFLRTNQGFEEEEMDNPAPKEHIHQWINTAIYKAKNYGYLDDESFAQDFVRSAIEAGKSKNKIIQKLYEKQCQSHDIDDAISAAHENQDSHWCWEEYEMSCMMNRWRVFLSKHGDDWDKNIQDKYIRKYVQQGFSIGIVLKAFSKVVE